MNIAEILKNCPKGTKLYSPVFGEVEFAGFTPPDEWIRCYTSNRTLCIFYQDGTYSKTGEVMLFPSKEQRDWSKFQNPFKFGDIIAAYNERYEHTHIAIFDKYVENPYVNVICTNLAKSNKIKVFDEHDVWNKQGIRYATEEEKEFFFNLLKEQGYYWTGTELVNRFNIGDTITDGKDSVEITDITESLYKGFDIIHGTKWEIPICYSKVWKLTKFDISSLKPYDKVLAKPKDGIWYPSLVSYVDCRSKQVFLIDSESSLDCVIPFESNEHLIGTRNNPAPYYITWE